MENNKPFTYLGAVGPLLRDYTPLSREEFDDWRTTRSLQDKLESEVSQALTSDERDRLLRLHRRVVMIAYGELFHQVRKQWPLLARAYALLDELDSIAGAEDGDAMKAKRDEIEALAEELTGDGGDTEGGDTEDTPFSFNKEAELIDEQIALFRPFRQSEPDPEDVSAMGPEAAAGATWLMTQPALWRESELMRWLRSGEFARALLTQAGDDERLQAYAYGYMTHVAAAVTGQPFINVIAGGPYRSHWWRQRLVANYVDTWVQGFYGASASMTGDEPHPPYEEWPDLCGAKLHERIDLGLGVSGLELVDAVLGRNAEGDPISQPTSQDLDALATFLSATATATYGADAQLDLAGFQISHDLTPEAFRRAYIGLPAVLWMQTGGEGDQPVPWRSPLCARDLQTVPPEGCEATPPDWVEEIGTPPQPSDREPRRFSIIALLMFLLGRLIEAIHSLLEASEAEQAVWSEVRCTLYWTRYMVRAIELKVAAFLVETTLTPPSAARLGGFGDIGGTIGPARDLEGRPLTRTTVPDFLYPRQMDRGTENEPHAPDIGYLRYPTTALSEIPEAEIWPGIGANRYPNFAIDGQGEWPLLNGGMILAAEFPARVAAGGSTAFFGNAVENAVQVIRANAEGLTNYNLDADRGYGWLAWRTINPDLPAVPPFDPVDAS